MARRALQVMSQTFYMCSVLGEPLSQTAQSFMPGFIHGVNRSLDKVRTPISSDILSTFFLFLIVKVWLHDTIVVTPISFNLKMIPYIVRIFIINLRYLLKKWWGVYGHRTSFFIDCPGHYFIPFILCRLGCYSSRS